MLSAYSPHQLPIFTELKSAYKKRNIQVIPDIWNFNIISNLCYFYFDVLFFSSLSFIFCLFYERKVELFFSLLSGLFFLFFKAISSFHKDEIILGNERECEQEITFLCVSKKLPSIFSVLVPFLFEWVWFDLRYEFAAYIGSSLNTHAHANLHFWISFFFSFLFLTFNFEYN